MQSLKVYIILTVSVLTTSCALYPQDNYVQQYVVETFLVADEPVPALLLTTTATIGEVYNKADRGVSNATVVIREFDESGLLQWTELMIHSARGKYFPQTNGLIIKPRHRYELEITVPEFDPVIRSTTVVPDTFSVLSVNSTRLPYQGREQFRLDLSTSFYPGRQSYYIFTTTALDSTTARLTPFYAQFSSPRSDFYVVSSGLLNENSTRQNETIVELVFPWIGVAFFGRNRIQASAVDDNIYDFYRSAGTQLGGGTQSPGEIENLIYNIDNAIGIFGSYAKISVDVIVDQIVSVP